MRKNGKNSGNGIEGLKKILIEWKDDFNNITLGLERKRQEDRAQMLKIEARLDKRIEQTDKRIEQMDKRIEQTDKRLDQNERRINQSDDKLTKFIETQEQINVKYGNATVKLLEKIDKNDKKNN